MEERSVVLPRYIREKPADLAGFLSVVDYTSKLSNLVEDFKKLNDFAQYIENQLKIEILQK